MGSDETEDRRREGDVPRKGVVCRGGIFAVGRAEKRVKGDVSIHLRVKKREEKCERDGTKDAVERRVNYSSVKRIAVPGFRLMETEFVKSPRN